MHSLAWAFKSNDVILTAAGFRAGKWIGRNYIAWMATASTHPMFAMPVKAGADWQILVTHSNGNQEIVGGFKTELDALNWMAGPASFEWGKLRGHFK